MKSHQGKAIIALGSNLAHEGLSGGALFLKALDEVEFQDLRVAATSSVWQSAPWPPDDSTAGQANYANSVIVCDVGEMSPPMIVALLQRVEQSFGRVRRLRWGARTLDLDLIDLDGVVGSFDGIIVPHPRAHERGFVLGPLAEIAPDWRHPLLNQTAAELLAQLPADENLRRLAPLR